MDRLFANALLKLGFALAVSKRAQLFIGNEPLPSVVTGYVENKTHWLKVPLISWEQTIHWRKLTHQERSNSFVLVDTDVGQYPYALKVEEEDWSTISKGSILIINTEISAENKDYAIVYKIPQNNPTLKQVMIDDDKIYLKSMNNYFPPTLFDEQHQFLGVLIQIRKDTKV